MPTTNEDKYTKIGLIAFKMLLSVTVEILDD